MDDWRARLPAAVTRCIDDLGIGLRAALAENLVALWLYGAVTFPGSEDAITDIDFHGIVRDPFTEHDRRAIEALYEQLGARYRELGNEMDGYYVLLDHARREEAPRSVRAGALDTSWALHRAHFHADRVIVWHGPHPREVVPAPSWAEIERALRAEFDETLQRWPDTRYAVLQTCRVLLSLQRRDPIVSKVEAGEWALGTLPRDWHELIRAAARSYRGAASNGDLELISGHARSFVEWARAR